MRLLKNMVSKIKITLFGNKGEDCDNSSLKIRENFQKAPSSFENLFRDVADMTKNINQYSTREPKSSFMQSYFKIKNFILKLLFKPRGGIYYVNGPDVLPPPLTKSEEAEIIKKIISGEENAREPLITHNLRLVVYIAKKFESSGANVEDLVSIGTIGLIKAVNTFCPTRNIKLATYASRCIENEILMFLRKISQIKNETSIDEPLNVDWDGNELLLSDVLGSDYDMVNSHIEQEAEKNVLISAVNSLPPREKVIMELRFGLAKNKEHTQKEVADMLGISQSYISRLEKRIITKLKRDVERVS